LGEAWQQGAKAGCEGSGAEAIVSVVVHALEPRLLLFRTLCGFLIVRMAPSNRWTGKRDDVTCDACREAIEAGADILPDLSV
jgi:hypothetical protein